VDLTPAANQPFHTPNGSIHAVVNGEIYRHTEIRGRLSSLGHAFVSSSDSEIVPALYAEYGISFLSHVNGEFAFCLYDSATQTLIVGTDRYGIKPLFYTVIEGRLLVASEAKAFLSWGWRPEWDVGSLRDGGWLCDGRTLFKGVRKVLPGSYLVINLASGEGAEGVVQHKYWDMDFKNKVGRHSFSNDYGHSLST
jgi:asparagine synthase (glutamine-hydrolysing)